MYNSIQTLEPYEPIGGLEATYEHDPSILFDMFMVDRAFFEEHLEFLCQSTLEIQVKIIDLYTYIELLDIKKDNLLEDVGEIHIVETISLYH